MEVKDIIKLDTYAGIDISVIGCIKIMFWSIYEKEKAGIYKKLSNIEYKTSKLIENRMKERHSAIAGGLLQQSEDATHLSNLLIALFCKWIDRLNEGVKNDA